MKYINNNQIAKKWLQPPLVKHMKACNSVGRDYNLPFTVKEVQVVCFSSLQMKLDARLVTDHL